MDRGILATRGIKNPGIRVKEPGIHKPTDLENNWTEYQTFLS